MIENKLFLEEFDDEPIEEAKKSKRRHKSRKSPYSSMTITTGDIGLNIDRFNTAMGTADMSDSGADIGASEGAGLGEALITEAKRYVRRYYIRPQNIFASNKAEIIKRLIEIEDQNCTIYTLNNLGDEKDVSKLTSNDIIYTYDAGILKDKNGVRIMDYDLSIKKEEERKKFANVDKASDKEFVDAYQDRMTDRTVIEALDLEFEDNLTATPRTFILYCHTNKQNNKKYFGITSQKDYSRWRSGEGYKNQPVFYAAIQKYGWDNFSHEIIQANLTEDEAKVLEQEYIKKYHTYVNDPISAGYNTTIGGESNLKYGSEEERRQALKNNQHRTYLNNRDARLAKAKQQYWKNPEVYKLRNTLKYAKYKDQYLAHEKEYQANLKNQLEIIRKLNKLFPGRLADEDLGKITNFRHCRNAEYINKLLALFTEREINKAMESEYEDRMTDATELEESQEVLGGTFNEVLKGIFDNCDYDIISADFTPMSDKVIITLNHNAYDIEDVAEELAVCLNNAGIHTIDWNTNGSNVFIFTLNPDNAFNLDFDDVNVYGESLTEAKHDNCCICGEPIDGNGHNPEPFMPSDSGRCCDGCQLKFVLPMEV